MRNVKTPTFWQDGRSAYVFCYSFEHHTFDVHFLHCYADHCDHSPRLFLWRNGERFRVFPDEVLKQMVQDVIDHEGTEPPAGWFDDKMDYSFVRADDTPVSCQDIVNDAQRRWDAIQLIVNPHISDNH